MNGRLIILFVAAPARKFAEHMSLRYLIEYLSRLPCFERVSQRTETGGSPLTYSEERFEVNDQRLFGT